MIIPALLQILIFLTFVSYIIYRFGVLRAISYSWYELKPYNLQYLFTIFCISIGFLMFGQMLVPGATFLWALSGSALCFTGIATRFKLAKTTEALVHGLGATGCVFGALLALGVDYNLWYPFISALIVMLSVTYIKPLRRIIPNRDWWLEIIGFSLILAGMVHAFLF